jgi:uncharacterized protein
MARSVTRAAALAVALLVVVWAGAAVAQPAPPQLTQPVNDFAHVIDPQSARTIDALIRSLQRATGDVVVVATVETFQPYATIDEYAVKMFQNGGRGLGEKGRDNGLLVVVAVNDRRVRLEVGYELEQFVTDGFAGQVRDEDLTPQFRQGNYGAGLVAGVQRLVGRIAQGRNVSLQDLPQEVRTERRRSSGGIPIFWLVIAFVVIRALVGGMRRNSRRGPPFGGGPGWGGWSSGVGPFIGRRGGFGGGGFGGGFGGGGGGFGGFGGGRSGGGGASGGW